MPCRRSFPAWHAGQGEENSFKRMTRGYSGATAEVLVEAASSWRADCIFLGARGLSGIERFLIGSVSASVAAMAGCSVEVVRSVPDH